MYRLQENPVGLTPNLNCRPPPPPPVQHWYWSRVAQQSRGIQSNILVELERFSELFVAPCRSMHTEYQSAISLSKFPQVWFAVIKCPPPPVLH